MLKQNARNAIVAETRLWKLFTAPIGNLKRVQLKLCFTLAVILAPLTANLTCGAPVVSTLPQTTSNNVGIGGTNDYAAGFVWASPDPFASADLYLSVVGNPAAPLEFSLYNDSGSAPGSEILPLNGPSDILAPGLYTYTGNIALTQGATYWIVGTTGLYNDFDNEYLWYDGTFGDPNYVDTMWRRPPSGFSWTPSGSITPAAFQVNSIPEPASVVFIGCSLCGTLICRRRRWSI